MPYTPEQDRFLLEAYFRSGKCKPDGEWEYSLASCQKQFEIVYPGQAILYDTFRQHVKRLANRFHNTGSICRLKSSGRTPIRNEKLVRKLKQIRELVPDISIGKLALHAGISYGTCQKIMVTLRKPDIEQVEIKVEINTEYID